MQHIANFFAGSASFFLWCVAFGLVFAASVSLPFRLDWREPSEVAPPFVMAAAGFLAAYGAWGLWP